MLELKRHLKVFLCHASQDKPMVRELYQRLKTEGWIDVWLDEQKLLPGQDWRLNIEEAVETSDIVIICLSKNSVGKEGFIQKEMRYAREISLEKLEGAIFLIPLRIDECDVPRGLRFYQWADYFGEKKDKTYNSLLEALRLRHEQKLKVEESLHGEKEKLEHKNVEKSVQDVPLQKNITIQAENKKSSTTPETILPYSPAPAITAYVPNKSKSWALVWIEVILKPNQKLYSEVINNPSVGSFSVYLSIFTIGTIMAIFSSLSQLLQQITGVSMLGIEFVKPTALTSESITNSLASSVTISPIIGLVIVFFLTVSTAFTYWIAKFFKGGGTFAATLYGLATLTVPSWIISAGVQLFFVVPYFNIIALLMILLFYVYLTFLQIMMIKTINNFEWKRAIGTYVIMFIISLLLLFMLIGLIALGVVAFLNLQP